MSTNSSPVQRACGGASGWAIPRQVAERAYAGYAAEYPSSASQQSLDRLSERGGFSVSELDVFAPGWDAGLAVPWERIVCQVRDCRACAPYRQRGALAT
jgi:hypothetical protein